MVEFEEGMCCMSQAYVCVLSARITLAKLSHVANPRVKGRDVHSVFCGKNHIEQAMDPGKGEEPVYGVRQT